jgi:hypothetical protein
MSSRSASHTSHTYLVAGTEVNLSGEAVLLILPTLPFYCLDKFVFNIDKFALLRGSGHPASLNGIERAANT